MLEREKGRRERTSEGGHEVHCVVGVQNSEVPCNGIGEGVDEEEGESASVEGKISERDERTRKASDRVMGYVEG